MTTTSNARQNNNTLVEKIGQNVHTLDVEQLCTLLAQHPPSEKAVVYHDVSLGHPEMPSDCNISRFRTEVAYIPDQGLVYSDIIEYKDAPQDCKNQPYVCGRHRRYGESIDSQVRKGLRELLAKTV